MLGVSIGVRIGGTVLVCIQRGTRRMADREKVIKGLECCMSEKMCRNKCPYKGQCDDGGWYYSRAIEDAIALLKAQEAVPPGKTETWEGITYASCGYCGNAVMKQYSYCPFCGRKVAWE